VQHNIPLKAFYLLISAILIFGHYLPAKAQPVTLNSIIDAYQAMNYNQTIELCNQAISEYTNYSREELITLYKFQALSYYHLGDTSSARQAFNTMLTINPNVILDPVTTSPKIITFYEQIKSEYAPDIKANTLTETRYIQLKDSRPSAAWRSLVLPGWGQLYKGESTKGYIIMSGFLLNSAALIAAVVNEQSAKDSYLAARDPNTIINTYDEYNKWHKTRQMLTYSQIIIWGYAIADAIWYPLPDTGLAIAPNQISFSFRF
jgi:tetratricopeptide (TPR) repeat protein